jgi:diamine N-acetyltransferase
MDIKIREYLPEDKAVVEQCVFELQEGEKLRQPHIWKDAEEIKAVYLDYAKKSAAESGGKIFVAEIGNKTAGFVVVIMNKEEGPAHLSHPYGYIMDLAVLKEYHKQGIGQALMQKAEEFVRLSGAEWMQLDVTVGNPARDFYAKSGYREKDIRMEKRLL